MKITIISAMTENRVIGKAGQLPWHIPKEFNHFKKMTLHKPIILGRTSFYGLPKSGLPNRRVIVLSSKLEPSDKYEVTSSIDEALELARGADEVMICGGTEVYRSFLECADSMILSIIKKDYPGDTYFPEFDTNLWKTDKEEDFEEFTIKYLSRLNSLAS